MASEHPLKDEHTEAPRRSAQGSREREGGAWARARATAARLALAGFAATLGGACARRAPLDRAELSRIDAEDPTREALRVHLARRLLVVHPADEADEALALAGGVVDERRTDRRLRVIVGRRRAGAVIAGSEDGRELWVSFDPTCRAIECAYGFIAVGAEVFRLAAVPGRERHRRPQVFRGREAARARMEPHLVDPTIDGSELLAIERRGRLRSIELEIRKRSRRQVRSATERARGFDRR